MNVHCHAAAAQVNDLELQNQALTASMEAEQRTEQQMAAQLQQLTTQKQQLEGLLEQHKQSEQELKAGLEAARYELLQPLKSVTWTGTWKGL